MKSSTKHRKSKLKSITKIPFLQGCLFYWYTEKYMLRHLCSCITNLVPLSILEITHIFSQFFGIYTFFSPWNVFQLKLEWYTKRKHFFLLKLVVQRLMITSCTSEACEYISYHSSIATLEINEIASCTDST